MKKTGNILWGILLILVGGVFALNALEITNIDIFFDGWWTLFIIVPCAIGLFTESDKAGNVIGIIIGVLLLLSAQGIIRFALLWKLAVPAIIIIIGFKLIFGSFFANKKDAVMKKLKSESKDLKNGFVAFSGLDLKYDGEVFHGAELNSIFGGIKCDLRGATIEEDCVINASAIFGGIDIIVPDGINIKDSSTSIFGGMSNKKRQSNIENAPTLYISGTCIFGGIEIK